MWRFPKTASQTDGQVATRPLRPVYARAMVEAMWIDEVTEILVEAAEVAILPRFRALADGEIAEKSPCSSGRCHGTTHPVPCC
ncbi:hypothetical protein AB0B45_21120 [Nonomuraea sp. NPDC049152]|uniref:hypothetical protein n=1 Tax=Nonomuraea sp. NPDC049152 TaxID=3154350 RepID=UPI0034103138